MDTWGGWCMETLVLAVLATWWCWTSKKGFRSLGEQYIFVIIVWYICSTYEICVLTFWNMFVQLTKYINFNGGTDRIGHTGNWLVVDWQKGLLQSGRSSNQGHLHVPTWNSFFILFEKISIWSKNWKDLLNEARPAEIHWKSVTKWLQVMRCRITCPCDSNLSQLTISLHQNERGRYLGQKMQDFKLKRCWNIAKLSLQLPLAE